MVLQSRVWPVRDLRDEIGWILRREWKAPNLARRSSSGENLRGSLIGQTMASRTITREVVSPLCCGIRPRSLCSQGCPKWGENHVIHLIPDNFQSAISARRIVYSLSNGESKSAGWFALAPRTSQTGCDCDEWTASSCGFSLSLLPNMTALKIQCAVDSLGLIIYLLAISPCD